MGTGWGFAHFGQTNKQYHHGHNAAAQVKKYYMSPETIKHIEEFYAKD